MAWRRSLETSGPGGTSKLARGKGGEVSGICIPGELTDRGRETSLAFGKWLRWLYVDQLGLLPKHLSGPRILYVRSTQLPRVAESVQQMLHNLYPPEMNGTSAPWDIAMRSHGDETLIRHTKSCARLAELTRAFLRRTAENWNGSDDMKYLSEKLGKWMPSKALTVDSRRTLSGVMDMINATLAHGPDTWLPDDFYDGRVRKVINRIVVDEWFGGYRVSDELRMLGAGPLMAELVMKMRDQVEWNRNAPMQSRSSAPPKLSLLGCHDSTISVTLASLGCLNSDEEWPPFTSHIIFELFRRQQPEVQEVDQYSVRVRYNDRIMTIPGCRAQGKHLDGNPSLCTLVSTFLVYDTQDDHVITFHFPEPSRHFSLL